MYQLIPDAVITEVKHLVFHLSAQFFQFFQNLNTTLSFYCFDKHNKTILSLTCK